MDKNRILKENFGYDHLKKEQEEIVDLVMSKQDVIALLPTGFGKSISFQLPALMLDGITIVISPLIALMKDQVEHLKEKKIKAEYINSLQDNLEQDVIINKIIRGNVKLIYIAAERLQNKKFLDAILNADVSMIVCDEAHTLVWSEDFREALGKIPQFIKKLKNRPRLLALTATATDETVNKIIKLLDLNNPKIVSIGCDRKNIFYRVISTHDKKRDLYFYLLRHKKERGLIYCLTIRNVINVYNYLKEKGFNVLMYHGAMENQEKIMNQNAFTSMNNVVMVCSNSFGMGIDVSDIRYVVEYDMPASLEDFQQQSGRASRDGCLAESIIFFNTKDIETVQYFIESIPQDNKTKEELKEIKKDRYYKLDKMVKFCLTDECLHKYVCNYFNVKHKGKCMMCSNCKK